MKTIILMFCLMAATCLQAQKTEDNGVESFKAIAPETVEQGVPFAVNFVLSATHWDAGAKARSGNGLTLTEASYKIERSEGNVCSLYCQSKYLRRPWLAQRNAMGNLQRGCQQSRGLWRLLRMGRDRRL